MNLTDSNLLRRRLFVAGVFDFHTARTTFKFMSLVAVGVGLFVGASQVGFGLSMLLLSLAALPLTTAAMIGHEGVHRSFAATVWANQVVAHVAFPVLTGLSVRYWKNKHNTNHHGHPNVEGRDDDLALWPMATSASAYEQSAAPRRFFQRNLQGVSFWPLTLFLSATMRLQSLQYLAKLAGQGKIDRRWAADAGCILLHYCAWLLVPVLVWGPLWALAGYLWTWALVGVFLSLIFAPAHIGMPIVSEGVGGWRHQLETTRNLRLPRWLSWCFVGLDHQVEHHLFPRICHQNLPAAADIVRRWCAEVGMPYHEMNYGPAILDATRYMGRAWSVPAR